MLWFESKPVEGRIADLLVHDLRDRRAIKELFACLDKEIQAEIVSTWRELIKQELKIDLERKIRVSKSWTIGYSGEREIVLIFGLLPRHYLTVDSAISLGNTIKTAADMLKRRENRIPDIVKNAD